VVVVAAVVAIVLTSHASPRVDITHQVTKVVAIDARHVGVWTLWTNLGRGPATESCDMEVTAFNADHQEIGNGRDVTGPNGTLKPGHTQRLFQVVIVNENGLGVTSPHDVEIVHC